MLLLEPTERQNLWLDLARKVEAYISEIEGLPVTRTVDFVELVAKLDQFDFAEPMEPNAALDFAVKHLNDCQLHPSHPGYFGLFNPAPSTMGIIADTLAAAFNTQAGSWDHAAFAVAVESHLIRAFAEKFGLNPELADGTFTSGGSEANHTAVLTALGYRFPEFAVHGTRCLSGQPTCYVSEESHHSLLKAVRCSGIGSEALRIVPVDENLQTDIAKLELQIADDQQKGMLPFMVVGTAGTTNSGVIDPLDRIAEISKRHGLWFHVDAAWGGAAAIVPQLSPLLRGIELADSITFDPHKWLSIPMGTGMYITSHKEVLSQTFQTKTSYMPPSANSGAADPYVHSLSWSRRFNGLKLFLTLAVAGWQGYEKVIKQQADMGDLLREKLKLNHWKVVNNTRLPVICFVDGLGIVDKFETGLRSVTDFVIKSGKCWISSTRLANNQQVLRACITNYRTGPKQIEALIETLNHARKQLENVSPGHHLQKSIRRS